MQTLAEYIAKLEAKKQQCEQQLKQIEGNHIFMSGRIQELTEQIAEASKSDDAETTEAAAEESGPGASNGHASLTPQEEAEAA